MTEEGGGELRPRLLGAVLAGGRSRRFGRSKAWVRLGGRSLAARAAATLEPVASTVGLLTTDADLARTLDLPFRPDQRPGLGPLGGLATALAWARDLELEGVALLACDLPLVPPSVLPALATAWDGARAVVPVSEGPLGIEPLCAVYPAGLLDVASGVLDEPDRAMAAFLGRVGVVRVRIDPDPGGAPPFLNVNRPGDLARAERLLGEDP